MIGVIRAGRKVPRVFRFRFPHMPDLRTIIVTAAVLMAYWAYREVRKHC